MPLTIKRDATPPSVDSVAAARPPDTNGWYNHAVAVTASGSDATSGIASCTSTTYSGPDATAASVTATCTDNAGNVSSTKALTFSYDATPPSVSAAPSRGADSNGWYNHGLSVAFNGSDSTSGIDSCTSASYSGPDSGSASVSGTCRDKAGNSSSASFGFQYDSTPPTGVAARADRDPDSDGWYNHALTVTYSGTDASSGIASCDQITYDKPDGGTASVAGVCRDNAGNVSGSVPFAFKYDSTPPKLTALTGKPSGGSVALAWSASSDVAAVKIARTRGSNTPVTLYSGKRITKFDDKRVQNGSRYSYSITVYDDAGNAVVAKVDAMPVAPLTSPPAGAHIRKAATLRWRAAKKASYYNVQVYLRGRKILSTWPTTTQLRLPHLAPGPYLWLVWPGVGARTAHRYGPLLGKSTFTVVK